MHVVLLIFVHVMLASEICTLDFGKRVMAKTKIYLFNRNNLLFEI